VESDGPTDDRPNDDSPSDDSNNTTADPTQVELTKAEEIAKQAAQLAARAEELARRAHEVAGIDEQLSHLERELADLDAEERTLDADLIADTDDSQDAADDRDNGRDHLSAGQRRILDLADTFGTRLEGLGDTIADVVNNAIASIPKGFESNVELEQEVNGATPLVVTNQGGSINVVKGADTVVRVRANRRSPRPGSEAPVVCELRDGAVHVEVKQGMRWPNITRLDVEVPEGSPIDLKMGGGSVNIEGVQGPVAAKTGGGSIAISDAVGTVVATSGGGSIAINNLKGSIAARTGGGTVRVSGHLTGDSSVASGGGSINVAVDDETSISVAARGHMVMTDVPGLSTWQRRIVGNIGAGSEGSLRVRTGGGAIRITRAGSGRTE
jgi:hypothetical protein